MRVLGIDEDAIIRKADPEDADRIKFIEEECHLSPWSRNDYELETKRVDSLFFIYEKNKAISGFLLARLITNSVNDNDNDIGSFSDSENSKSTEPDIEIFNIGVLNKFRRHGIALNLFNFMLEKTDADGRHNIILDVRVSNRTAINFYRSVGFEIITRRRLLYTNPREDGYFMKFIRF